MATIKNDFSTFKTIDLILLLCIFKMSNKRITILREYRTGLQ